MGIPDKVELGNADEEEQKELDRVEKYLQNASKNVVTGFALTEHLMSLRMKAFIDHTQKTLKKKIEDFRSTVTL